MRHVRLFLLTALAGMTVALPAQTGTPAPTEAPAPTAGETETTSSPASIMSNKSFFDTSVFDDIGFKALDFDLMSSDGQGKWNFKGRIEFRSDQFNLDSDTIEIDTNKNIMIAKGTPILIKMETLEAECKELTYDIENKRLRLMKDPVIIERQPDKILTISADIITVDQKESGTSVNMETLPDSTNRGSIKVTPVAKPEANGETKPKPANGRKIREDNTEFIKIPGLE